MIRTWMQSGECCSRRLNADNIRGVALYDTIGRTYDATRRADPEITSYLVKFLNLERGASYLDVACGTGNYTSALANLSARMFGIDQSSTMLDAARRKNSSIKLVRGDAELLPFRGGSFRGAICTWAIHHMRDYGAAFREIFRVIECGRFVLFGADPSQVAGYWLNEYFPSVGRIAGELPTIEAVEQKLRAAGFSKITRQKWDIPETVQDWFFYAGKHHPEIYFDKKVRDGISIFAKSTEPAQVREIEEGLARLREDLESGRFAEVANKYRHDRGDCTFVIAEKQ